MKEGNRKKINCRLW